MKNILIGMVVSLLIILGLTFNWGYDQYNELNSYNLYVENQFRRMFYDLVGNVENIQSDLAKIMVTGTPNQNVLLFTDLMYKCYDAQEDLTQLPIKHKDVSKTQKFLSQVGDFSMAMSRKCLRGKTLTADDMKTLEKLHNYSNYLAQSLLQLQKDITKDEVKLNALIRNTNKKLDKTNDNILNTSFLNVEERMQEYPELIYDGPFSEHLKNIKPKLEGKEISKNEAKRIAREFLKNDKKYEIDVISETENTRFPAYIIQLRDTNAEEGYITFAITKKAGKVIWMLNTKPVGHSKLSLKDAVKKAKEFLQKSGFDSMVATYSEEYDGTSVINFAYKQDNVIVYTDLIKVKVSLDDGSIVGFEAEGYLSNHHQRKIDKPQISEEDALNMISIDADVKKARLAIIPTEGSKEVLCYEVIANYKEDNFLIYINAVNGEEERILQMIIKEQGVLMM
ncbi:germination protein YpeB [Paramaledivibacter caminithermalis]|uniref:Germination protein YpeB n=1 Tax=Paramaledivibacter caminithermalis (strain DSM 15212 / CIP 107654 / DViRD3) TaxID=1121301 RepID=A0A1M6LEX3_PARC5|nr:germination protein YpeB [Paramaledivibacter caminithermalis]SHJ69712.1 germination protein YpeB [Paramaledivibacter caminithermalis DSM 15212]